MRVTIEDRNPDGRGRGRDQDKVVLVSQAHPGEEVSVRVDLTTRGTVQGRVARLVREDPRRIRHSCPHEFHCTGCPLLAAAPDDEAAFKAAELARRLASIEGAVVLPSPEPVLSPGPLFGYRHLAKMHFLRRGPRTVLGSYVAGTHRPSDNTSCAVLVEPLRRLMDGVAETAEELRTPLAEDGARGGLRSAVARQSRKTGEQLLVLVTSEADAEGAKALAARLRRDRKKLAGVHILHQEEPSNVVLAGRVVHVDGAAVIEEEMLGYRHRLAPLAFFQINPAAAEVMFRIAVEMAGQGERCVEGYAGVGALTLPLTERFGRVVAVESSPDAVASLSEAARQAGGGRVQVVSGRVEREFETLLGTERPEAVVLDPPRAGAGPEVLGAVGRSTASRCVLLACAPDALARDLPVLTAAGFAISRIVPIDQFPRTAHLEVLVLAERPR